MCKVNVNTVLKGDCFEISEESDLYPENLKLIPDSPHKLYLIGNPYALQAGLAVVGARKATPYGLSCTEYFSEIAANQGIVIISGGAYGCDSAAHKAALKAKAKTVVFLGGGCNSIYPTRNYRLYQDIINLNGAVVSEKPWDYQPLKHTFLDRNRLIAGLSKALLVTEASVPSGTFSTVDYAIKYNKEVIAVPGAITNPASAGCNRLIYQGAMPIINDEAFYDFLFKSFACLKPQEVLSKVALEEKRRAKDEMSHNPILKALLSQPMHIDSLYDIARKNCKDKNPSIWLSQKLVEAESSGKITKYSNGLYGPVLK